MYCAMSQGRLCIKYNRTHAQEKRRIQDWLKNNRPKFQKDISFNRDDSREKSDLTFHGLRHSYTRTGYYENLNQGMNKKEARKDVSRNLGHGRDSVTHAYLQTNTSLLGVFFFNATNVVLKKQTKRRKIITIQKRVPIYTQ